MSEDLRKEVAAALDKKRLQTETESTETVVKMLATCGVTATYSQYTDPEGLQHPAVVLTPDQYPAMMRMLKQAGLTDLLT